MKNILLPPRIGSDSPIILPSRSQISIVGANGAGKTKFMNKMIELSGDDAFSLSALEGIIPKTDDKESSIGLLFEKKIEGRSYQKKESSSQLEKLIYLLLTDEFESLMNQKLSKHSEPERIKHEKETKLDKLIRLWEKIFPGNKVLQEAGKILFSTTIGNDHVSIHRLSQGERAVLYYIAGVLYAPKNALIFIDSPSLFLHPSILNNLWNSIENLRQDCNFIYNSVDMDFLSSRSENTSIWVKSYSLDKNAWDYEILERGTIPEELYSVLLGNRKPVMFVEGDNTHSIDMRLYRLVFSDYIIRPLGSCNKVIESVRSFNDLKLMHKLDSKGIVDRDRRTENEVAYLRNKNILVPEVAEVENFFLIEPMIKTIAKRNQRDPEKVFNRVKDSVMKTFSRMIDKQALEHVRHRVKRDVERRIDAKFTCITALEMHLNKLNDILKPRETFYELQRIFKNLIRNDDYNGVLKVFNYKPMLSESNVASLLGYGSTEQYIHKVMNLLKSNNEDSRYLKEVIKSYFIPKEEEKTNDLNVKRKDEKSFKNNKK